MLRRVQSNLSSVSLKYLGYWMKVSRPESSWISSSFRFFLNLRRHFETTSQESLTLTSGLLQRKRVRKHESQWSMSSLWILPECDSFSIPNLNHCSRIEEIPVVKHASPNGWNWNLASISEEVPDPRIFVTNIIFRTQSQLGEYSYQCSASIAIWIKMCHLKLPVGQAPLLIWWAYRLDPIWLGACPYYHCYNYQSSLRRNGVCHMQTRDVWYVLWRAPLQYPQQIVLFGLLPHSA